MEEHGFAIAITVIFLFISFYHLLIAILGLFPSRRATAVGILKTHHTRRNVKNRVTVIPVVTDYVYQYTVKGKRYIYRSSGRFEKSRLHKKVTMVYVKGFPRRAYPERFTALNEWCWGIGTLLMGLAFILVILWA